jgi:holo-[acyl-carrier protein] synthase
MVIGCGIDLVNINRIKKIITRWDRRFLKKIYTKQEISYCEKKKGNRFHSYAGFFAAKEAWVKAIGTGFRNIKWKEIEVKNDNLGKPEIYLSKRLIKKIKKKEINKTHLSISHTEELAIALVIIET